MSTENGNGVHVSETLKVARTQIQTAAPHVLPDMNDGLGGVRAFLTGGKREDGYWPAGTFSLRFAGQHLHLRLALADLELEARYQESSWSTLWDMVNNDLELNTVPWQLDYKGQQRLRSQLLS